jgi:hypothetical protein
LVRIVLAQRRPGCQYRLTPGASPDHQGQEQQMTNHPNRAAIRQDGSEVVLRCTDNLTGERIERRFWAPPGGGYVREVTAARPGTLGQQVCAGLAHMGGTLSVKTPADLLPLIRREWQAAKRQARGERAGW